MPPLVPISGSTSSPNLPKTPLSQRQMLEAVKGVLGKFGLVVDTFL